MSWFSKPQPEPRKLTGARVILKAEHRDQSTGVVHGHEWEITAWWRWTGTSAEIRQHQLETTVEGFQGKCLPDRLAWAENLAEHIGQEMDNGWSRGDPDCVTVQIVRHKEGLLARWDGTPSLEDQTHE